MAYTRTHDFTTDTGLVAGVGDPAAIVGLNDEIVAAYEAVTRLPGTWFEDGALGAQQLAQSHAEHAQVIAVDGRILPLQAWTGIDPYPWYQGDAFRVLGSFEFHGNAAKIHCFAVAIADYDEYARFARISFRLRTPTGPKLCRDLELQRDFPKMLVHGALWSRPSIAAVPALSDRMECIIGGPRSDVPLQIADIPVGEAVFVVIDWSALLPKRRLALEDANWIEDYYPADPESGTLIVEPSAPDITMKGSWSNPDDYTLNAWLDSPAVTCCASTELYEP